MYLCSMPILKVKKLALGEMSDKEKIMPERVVTSFAWEPDSAGSTLDQ